MKCSINFCFLLVGASYAFQLPFSVPFFTKQQVTTVEDSIVDATPRIAIIGAGAGGSSAAFWISKAKERFGVDVEVDVFDLESYIGGRSTTVYPYHDHSLPEIELGASIFVKVNKNMWRASEEFNLTRRDFHEEEGSMGIWDGQQLLFTIGGSWWDTLKVIWRYGVLSPKRTKDVVSAMMQKFLTLYTPEAPTWDNLSHLAEELGWTDLVNQTTDQFLQAAGVSSKFTHELVEAATRVNYGQNVDAIHALEGACSMADSGAVGIKGGNFLIFEQFLKRSGAKVHLNTTVASITHRSASSHDWTIQTKSGETKHYKGVIIATPFHTSGIKLSPSLGPKIPPQPYVHLHVTILVTNSSSFDPTYFGLAPGTHVPKMMLTTAEGERQGGPAPEFNSISYHGVVREGEWAVKIFSDHRIEDELLERVLPQNSVRWVYRKEWYSYPKLPPTDTFPPIKLDTGLYYVNAFEPFISTMETEIIAARNVVQLLLSDKFASSICGPRISSSETGPAAEPPAPPNKADEDFVLGWDC
ncbi:hypothetical protein HGRIS_007496 [Hohenbuehelia grisea]|uniref:Prenylcysteine lyase domain-containing protein n=1 Tax=Hohenbuehelia grisea TaxID=104357 RepID=A0ABR3J4Z8_9AGAR